MKQQITYRQKEETGRVQRSTWNKHTCICGYHVSYPDPFPWLDFVDDSNPEVQK